VTEPSWLRTSIQCFPTERADI